jgi:vancomycin resistance protein YoaR
MAKDNDNRVDEAEEKDLDVKSEPLGEEEAPARKKKSGRSITATVLLSLAIVLFLAGGVLGLLYYNSYRSLEEMKAAVDVEGFYPGITVDGQDVGGRSYEDVRNEVLARQQAEADARVLTVSFEGQNFTLPAQSAYDTEQVLVDAYNYAKEGELKERYDKVIALRTQPLDFATTVSVTVDGVDAFIRQIETALNVEAKDATVGSFDAENKTFTFTEESPGRAVDSAKLRADIEAVIASGDFSTPVTPVVQSVLPTVTKAQLEAQNTLLGSFTTETTSSSSRNTNIRLCSSAFNGYVVAPGETFSINTLTGPRTSAKGYKEAGSIQNGILIQEPGGGVCQVSTTLFNAVVRAGMEIVERHGHSWPSDYVKIGMDAAIDYPAKDFKFKNTSDAPIYLVSTFEDRKLTVEVYGKPVVEEGVTIELRSTTDSTMKRGDDIMVFDDTLAPGQNKTVRKGRDGKKSTTYIQYVKDGKVIEEKVLFTTTYPAIRAIVNYGPDIVYEEPTPTPTEPVIPPEEDNIWD